MATRAVAPGHAVRARREEMDEMLGNLLDNACKWARSRVTVQSAAAGGEVAIAVDDDGPDLEPQLRESVLRGGVRADEAAPGSGLGWRSCWMSRQREASGLGCACPRRS